MEGKYSAIRLDNLYLDKELMTELAGAHMKWLRYLVLAELGVAVLNSALLLTGTILYGKKTVEILRKKVEQSL